MKKSFIPFVNSLLLGSTIEKINFFVAHWRRGDQLTSSLRCRNGLDNSVNCGSVQHFDEQVIETVHNLTVTNLNRDPAPIIYVCTNEEAANNINELKHSGYVLFHDLINYASSDVKARKLASLNSLEVL